MVQIIEQFGREEDIPAHMVVAAILMSLKMYPAILIFVLPLLIWIAPGINISVDMVIAVIGAVAALVVRYIFESKGYVIEMPDLDAP